MNHDIRMEEPPQAGGSTPAMEGGQGGQGSAQGIELNALSQGELAVVSVVHEMLRATVDEVVKQVSSAQHPVEVAVLQRAVEEGLEPVRQELQELKMRLPPDGPGNQSDGDDEGEAPIPPLRKKKTTRVKRGPKPDIDKEFFYLEGPAVDLYEKNGSKRVKRMMDPPTRDQVAQFTIHGLNPPTLPRPRFDWNSPLTSTWNRELISKIGKGFLNVIADIDDFTPEHKSRERVEGYLLEKLKVFMTEYRKARPANPFEEETNLQKQERIEAEKEKQLAAGRRRIRRRGIHTRRIRKVQDVLKKNPLFWGEVLVILDALTEHGMSSDETETEARRIDENRSARRQALGFPSRITALPLRSKAGNSPYPRIHEPMASMAVNVDDIEQSHTHQFVPGLPLNYYCELWYGRQSASTKELIMAADGVVLPQLPRRDVT
ncbi:hypothetical protein DFP72DRAFT_855686 [Ephemerocybe angulata]|uniref:Uncharacterized protein n=1 Tax=Ephemerocybe angulata TaxID=980116 RepID=A0A8H6HHX2_9AGAR|nr:hypothetical protein DFP72DRAFT_855686 [Tulosesus angulatus]